MNVLRQRKKKNAGGDSNNKTKKEDEGSTNNNNDDDHKLQNDLKKKNDDSPTATEATSGISNSESRPNNLMQRRCSYVHTQPPPILYVITSHRADALLSALGAFLCLGLLTKIQQRLNINMMASFLCSASIKMFYNREPPPLDAFFKSSLFGIPAGSVLHYVMGHCGDYGQALVVSTMLFYWKLNGEMWTASNSLAIYLALGSGSWDMYTYPWKYLFTPYLIGHLMLYIFALGWSKLRIRVRAILIRKEFFNNESKYLRQLSTKADQKLRLQELFDRMDLDHDGRLDVHELQLAFRSALGCDISLQESQYIMKLTDTDGDSTLDFHEFCTAIDKMIWGT